MAAITGFRVKHGMTDTHRPLELQNNISSLFKKKYYSYTELTLFYKIMWLHSTDSVSVHGMTTTDEQNLQPQHIVAY